MTLFILLLVNAFTRIINPVTYHTILEYKGDEGYKLYMTFLTLTIILIVFIKALFYLRVFPSFGELVELFTGVGM